MLSVLLTIHLIACIALVIAVMLQRSEGGALGMSGGGTGGLISGRGAAGVLQKITMGLAAVFFCTSLVMTRLNNETNAAPGVLERQIQQDGTGGVLGPLTPAAPSTTAPATPAPAPAIDPLAPSTAPAAPATASPSGSAPAATTPAAPAQQPAPQPGNPAPAENGGSNN